MYKSDHLREGKYLPDENVQGPAPGFPDLRRHSCSDQTENHTGCISVARAEFGWQTSYHD